MEQVIVERPIMHCHTELERDLGYDQYLPDSIMLNWFRDFYSTSKHLLTLFSLANGLQAKNILEIGFGRSSFVLAKAAGAHNGKFTTCDMRDFSYLLNEKEKSVTNYVCGMSDEVWETTENESLDFAFLDYFSGESITEKFVEDEMAKCLEKMKGNSIIAIHDVFDNRYVVGKVLEKMAKSWKYKKKINFSTFTYNYGLGIIHVRPHGKVNILKDTQLKKVENV
jgi:hypothetical protein